MHLGFGNFHRAHQAVYTAAALAVEQGPWGILGVANRSRSVVDSMNAQDLLYSVVEISPAGSRVTVPGVHTGVMVADDAPEAVVDAIAAPATRVVTLTVTEHGYTTSPRTGTLDMESPAVRHDLVDPSSPMTTIGRIAAGLVARARTHGAPVAILSCDNLLANGERTEALVREFIAAMPSKCSDETLSWMDRHVSFPNSMVDRIVPSGADRYNEAVRTSVGVIDEIAVPAEPFTMWVMQDRFPGGRPAWEVGGATFADDVEPYELMKLRLLNGTHSLIAYLGALDGRATIPESIAQPFIESAARQVMLEVARSAGAHRVLHASDADAIAAVEADVVFECSGNHRGLGSAICGAVRGGTVVMVGLLPTGDQPVPISLAITRELELVGSFRFNDEIDDVIAALGDGSLNVSTVITAEYPAADALEAFAVASDAGRSSKVLLAF